MFIDASALTAILTGEPDADGLVARLGYTKERMTSPLAIWETATAVARILGLPPSKASKGVLDYLDLSDIQIVVIPVETTAIALDAFDRYGKGRHPAGLNFGDCFAYACARHFGQPLMFKGSDFAQTDIEAA